MRSFLRSATICATKEGRTARSLVEAIAVSQFTSHVVNGMTIVRVSGNGADTEFAVQEGLSPNELIELASDTLDWIDEQPDPENPGLPTKIRRLRVAFDRATL